MCTPWSPWFRGMSTIQPLRTTMLLFSKELKRKSFFQAFCFNLGLFGNLFLRSYPFSIHSATPRTAEWKVGAAQTAYGALTHRDFWLVALLCSSGPIHFKHNLLMRSEYLWSLCCSCAIVLILVIETIDTLERCSKKLRKCIWILERFFFNFHKCRWPHWSSKSHRLMLVTCNPSKFFLYVTAVIVAVE